MVSDYASALLRVDVNDKVLTVKNMTGGMIGIQVGGSYVRAAPADMQGSDNGGSVPFGIIYNSIADQGNTFYVALMYHGDDPYQPASCSITINAPCNQTNNKCTPEGLGELSVKQNLCKYKASLTTGDGKNYTLTIQ